MSGKKVVVLGGGITGLATAEKLCEKGFDVTVIEKNDYVGGISTSFKHKGYWLDFGPHKIYTQMPHIQSEFERIIGKKNLLDIPKRSRVRLLGKYYNFPVGLKDMLLGMNPLVGLRCGMYYGITLLSSVVRKKEDVSYEDYLVNRFGRGIFDLVFGQYAKKVWGEPSELSAELARTRVAIPSLLVMLKNMIIGNKGDPKVSADVFHYPKSGIKELPENLSKNIMKKNGKILFQSEPIEIITKDRNMKQVKIRQKNTTLALDADYCISTIPLCETAKLLRPKATKEVIKHADSLKYRSLILLYVVVDKNRLFDDNWIFYPEEEFIFNRLSEQKGFSESMIPKGKTVLCVEITVDNSDPLLKAGDKKIFERAIKDLEKADIIKKKEAIDFFTVVLKDIYPIYGLDFREHVDSVLGHIDEVEGLITNGRPGLFNYNNMDHCLDMGFIAASHVISGKKNVDWVKTRRKFDEYRIVD